MRRLLYILLLGQLLMGATISTLQPNNTTIPLITEQSDRLPLVTMQLVFTCSGSITDTKEGLAKLSAKLLGEGTKTHGSSRFADLLESKAIHISTHAGVETFVIELSCLSEEFDEALFRLKELLLEPNITEETLEKVKTKTYGAIQSKANDFDYIAGLNLKKTLFGDTPLAHTALGTHESIQSITLLDVQEFLAQHLQQSNLIVAVGGDIPKKLQNKLSKVLEVLKKGSTKELSTYEATSKEKKTVTKKETKQAYIYFGSPYKLSYNDNELYKAKVATFILGSSGFGSRLMEEVRVKKGLAYSAYARLHSNKTATYLSGYLQTKLSSEDEAIQTVKKVLSDFVENGVSSEELEQTKKFLLGSEPLRNETMSQRLSRSFFDYYKGFKPKHYQEELQKIEALQLDDLNNFIHKHKEITKISLSIVTNK